MKKLIISLFIPITLFAETLTTNNLLLNPNFENGTSNNWTQSGDGSVISDCCNSSYDYEFGDSGSIEQTVNLTSDDITTQMLDNGIKLTSSALWQNGECAVQGCWGGQGNADVFITTLKVLDANGEILATTTNIRTDTTNIYGSIFTDELIYNGTGSYFGSIFLKGEDANAPATLGAGNVDDISFVLEYDNTVLSVSQTEEIKEIEKEIKEVFIPEEINIEEVKIE